MKISIIGSGYVGTTTALCLAELGNEVTNIDIDKEVVDSLNSGELHIHEPKLGNLLEKHLGKNFKGSTDYSSILDTELTFLCLPTPAKKSGEIDLSIIEEAADQLGRTLQSKNKSHFVVVKSTVVPGTTERIGELVEKKSSKELNKDLFLGMNPEFLREGSAVKDFMEPDKLVLGGQQKTRKKLKNAYRKLIPETSLFETDIRTAEMIKYANNSLLATKISFANEIGNLCKQLNIDSYEVMDAVGLDHRVNRSFLDSGVGFGGSCLVGSEEIMVKDGGEVDLVSFVDFFDRYVDSPLLGDVRVLSKKGEGFSFEEVEAAIKREYDGEIVEVETSMNKKIEVTADHPMLVFDGEDIEVKKAGKLKTGDRLPLLREIPEDPVGSFDLIEVIKESGSFNDEKVYLRPNFDLSKLKDGLRENLRDYNSSFSYDRVYDFVRGNYLPLDIFLGIEDDLGLKRSDFRIYTTKGNATLVPAILAADKDFWRFIGYYISEGHINIDDSGHGKNPRKRIIISFHPTDEEEYVEEVIDFLTGCGIKYRINKKETSTEIVFSSRILAHFLSQHLECGKGSYSAKLPSEAYQESKENKKALLSGLFRGDGHIAYPSHTNAVVFSYGSVSEELIRGMQFLLHSLDIVPSYKTSRSKKSTKDAHFLRISGKKQIKQLKDIFLREDQEKIEERLNNYDKEIQPTGHKKTKDYTTVKIRNISTKNKETIVYSIEMNSEHNFVTTNGLITHNCFPKDVKALKEKAKKLGIKPKILKSVLNINKEQPKKITKLLEEKIGDLEDKRIGVLGLAFKPGTDDIRNSRSIPVIKELKDRGAEILAHDPKAIKNTKEIFPDIQYFEDATELLSKIDGCLLLTDWEEYNDLDIDVPCVEGRRLDKCDGICW
ncbi:MAG: UDP-glucose 6-dehydrogenase, aglM/ugd [Candidatus Methanohalarchaeum thermophilum]|uniref:UDP-glucose 6-dehydrogenase, aglM/ugd n=1 Tax=Methanohalarchaeum thermophilum TaxID=1903181 RepID=A0A1Q6DSS2_METT1|nr:MAG: UDP-glucose 6-dehydrogenase, aglM/ugd [Candidatus Methanohalarchaeum thermophilum]